MADQFEWEEKSTCGDTPPDSCAPLQTAKTVKSLIGTDPVSGCAVDLVSDEYPSVHISINDGQTELRSGSATKPIPLQLVKRNEGASAPELAFRDLAGELGFWRPNVGCNPKKVVFKNGAFTVEDDSNSNVFNQDCIGSFSDCEFIVGARRFTDCEGNSRYKLVFFPVSELPTPPE